MNPLSTVLPNPFLLMRQLRCRHTFKATVLLTISCLALFSSCVKRPFTPVNEGREYGNPKTPMLVSHVPEKNQWTLNRVDHHHIFKRIICFDYICRKMIGRSKTLLTTSKKECIKVMKRNAERGFFKSVAPAPTQKPVKRDSLFSPDAVHIPNSKVSPAPVAPTLKADSLITLSEFLFETNSYKLRDEHFYELDALSQYLKTHPTLEVNITGHTDNTGDERSNIRLSASRAEAVAEYLVGRGVDYDKVIFKGLGSSQPIMGNETQAGRSKNRRVEILIRSAK